MVRLNSILSVDPESLQQLANNKNIAQNLMDVFPHPYTLDHARSFLERAAKGMAGHVFGIFDDATFVGVGSVIPKEDVYRLNAEIGYWLGEPYWGKGYGTEAVKLLTQYGFETLQLIRMYAGVFAGNTPSMRVLERAGFRQEAILRSAVIKNGKVLDQYLYSKLA
ncbi:GNAT family N-acetyltransferase [Arcticibacter sp. MXS-1]|uniref:GNAT family N-acetyltransferase n=1 Tax=Arcticibacter sp. MXS-1 TaxID=3341726 RepID=UPI0035A8ECAD